MLIAPPLSLYIHIPWCVEKCPYCDFNSHTLKHAIPEQDYVAQLLLDLDTDIARFNLQKRPLHSIFIGPLSLDFGVVFLNIHLQDNRNPQLYCVP